jgi:hypothetical protein
MSLTVNLDTRVLSRVADLTHQRLGEALQTLGEEIVAEAKAVVLVDTGRLRDSIEAEVIGDLEIEVHDGVSYGVVIEYGRGGTNPRPAFPFLTPAVEKARSRLPELVAAALQRATEGF